MTAPAPTPDLDVVFAALANGTRRAILARLAESDASVTDLVAPLALSQPAISKHLGVLERAGLVTRRREAQFRYCRLNAGPLGDADQWLAAYRRFYEQQIDRLDAYVQTLKAGEQQERTHVRSTRRKRARRS